MSRQKLNAKTLRRLLFYCHDTGAFTWRVKPARHLASGSVAGHKAEDGGLDIRLHGVLYRAHRLAWLYMTGEWPRWTIDHINGKRRDNRWMNLRDVPHD